MVLKDQAKTLAKSEAIEKKREAIEQKDFEEALAVRMKEVEKFEKIRLQSQMQHERSKAKAELECSRKHFDKVKQQKLNQIMCKPCCERKPSCCGFANPKCCYEQAKTNLEKAIEDMKQFSEPSQPCCSSQIDADIDSSLTSPQRAEKISASLEQKIKENINDSPSDLGTKLAELIHNEKLGDTGPDLMKYIGIMVNEAKTANSREERFKNSDGFRSAQQAVEDALTKVIEKKK